MQCYGAKLLADIFLCFVPNSHQDDAFARHHFFTSDKFMIFEFVIAADEELKFLEHVATKGYRIRPHDVISMSDIPQTPSKIEKIALPSKLTQPAPVTWQIPTHLLSF